MTLISLLAAQIYADGNQEERHDEESHAGHSDALLTLLGHKIALQKLQDEVAKQTLSEAEKAKNLFKQKQRLAKVMPILVHYMETPKSYYLTTEMYHDSLENRAAMLSDFTQIVSVFQSLSYAD